MASDPILGAFENRARHHGSDLLLTSPLGRQVSARFRQPGRFGGEPSRLPADCPKGLWWGSRPPMVPRLWRVISDLRRASHPVLLIDWPTPQAELERIQHALSAEAILVADKAWPESDQDFDLLPGAAESESPALPAEVSTLRLSSGSTGLPQGNRPHFRVTPGRRPSASADDGPPHREGVGLDSVVPCLWIQQSFSAGSYCRLDSFDTGGSWPFCSHHCRNTRPGNVLAYSPCLPQSATENELTPTPSSSSVRLVISAGAPLRPATVCTIPPGLRTALSTLFYGASEVGGIAYDRVGRPLPNKGTLGPALEGVTIRLIPIKGERMPIPG